MKATINDVVIEGTPGEINEFLEYKRVAQKQREHEERVRLKREARREKREQVWKNIQVPKEKRVRLPAKKWKHFTSAEIKEVKLLLKQQLTVKEVAEKMGITPQHIYNLTYKLKIPMKKLRRKQPDFKPEWLASLKSSCAERNALAGEIQKEHPDWPRKECLREATRRMRERKSVDTKLVTPDAMVMNNE
jgi:DNA-binding CsgD family transcriptional regulator